MTDARARALWIAGSVGVFLFCSWRLDVTHDVTHFLPGSEDATAAVLSRQLAESSLSRRMVLLIEGADAAAAAGELTTVLADHPEVAFLETGLDSADFESIYSVYFPRRHFLISDRPDAEIPRLADPVALGRRADALRAELARPTGGVAGRLAPADPLGLFNGILERLRAGDRSLQVVDGHFRTRDGNAVVLFLETRHSAFASEHQRPLLEAIDGHFESIRGRRDDALSLSLMGLNRIAVSTELAMRRDLSFISTAAVLGVCGLFLLFFRSARSLALGAIPPAVGILGATAFGIAAFHPLHGVTVAFGVSLVGVAIDYSIHLLNHHVLLPSPNGARGTVARLRPSLLLGAGTTLVSFAALSLTRFPGVREMGLYAAVGIACALGATLYALPRFLRPHEPAPRAQDAVARALGRGFERLQGAGARLLALPLAALVVAATGIPLLEWRDDPSQLTTPQPEILAEDAAVRARVSSFDPGRFVVALGPTPDAALAANDRAFLRLERAREAGALESFRSLHSLLWSRELQERNRRVLRDQPGLGPKVEAVFSARGFRAGAFAEFRAALAETESQPLVPEDLDGTPLARLRDALLVPLEGQWAAVTTLRNLRDPSALETLIADLPDVHLLDQQALLAGIYARYRTTTLRLIGVGSALVLLLLAARYRNARRTLAAFLPSLFAAGATFGVLGWLGLPVNLLHVVSLILVLGMGVDYGVFAVDSVGERRHLEATLLSLLLSCTTTLFVFGVLAFSEHPALSAIGQTTGLGILFSLAFAPVALALANPATEHRRA
ncbi:MAG: MMPL family transporter [Proteobacteria bacterium]|nr:MMPL family transporter [Pseudomonadota bacterium]